VLELQAQAKKKGITQKALAGLIGVHAVTLSNYAHGKGGPPPGQLCYSRAPS
jgi:transcriptional regulator with XRE-family HTH domain